jgi:hypothetical protein
MRMMDEYEDDMLERDMQEIADHGVRGYCTRHKQVIVDECDDCADEEERKSEGENI